MATTTAPSDILKGFVHEIDCNDQPIEILPLADLHVGDANSNMKLISELIESVKTMPNRYCILDGDLMNTAIVGSKSDSYHETMTPGEQLTECAELFSPIKDKILSITPGNHEERISRTAGVDMTELFARELDLQHVYSPDAALLFLRFGCNVKGRPLSYSLYISHGHGGGGRKVGSKLNALQDYSTIIDADIFIVGHTHLPATFKQSSYRICPQSGSAILHEQVFVNTASALGYGGYGKRGGYQPPSNSYPVITLDDKIHNIRVTI